MSKTIPIAPEGLIRLHSNQDILNIHEKYDIPALALLHAVEAGLIQGIRFGTQPTDLFVTPEDVFAVLGDERIQAIHIFHDSDHRIVGAVSSCNAPSRNFSRTAAQAREAARKVSQHVHSIMSVVKPNEGLKGRRLSAEEAIKFVVDRDYINSMPALAYGVFDE